MLLFRDFIFFVGKKIKKKQNIMTTYNVSIPENKNAFFLEILEFIGARYEKENDDSFELSDEQKKILDECLEEHRKNPTAGKP